MTAQHATDHTVGDDVAGLEEALAGTAASAPEASTGVNSVVPNDGKTPVLKPPVVNATAPGIEAANDALGGIVHEAEQVAATYIAGRAAQLQVDASPIAAINLQTIPAGAATSADHCSGGANCAHCTAQKDVQALTSITQAPAVAATEAMMPAPAAVPQAGQPAVTEAQPQIQSVTPAVTQVAAPAQQQGRAASDSKHELSA